ncbi:SDR family NAD(P)-dependent oxidoreductase [Spirochaeta dissipatitropha]
MNMISERTIMTAVITGASSGLGRELAIQSASRGMLPILLARSHSGLLQTMSAALEALPEEYSWLKKIADENELCISCDLALDPAAAAEQVRSCMKKLADRSDAAAARLMLLVNNAGAASFGDFAGERIADLSLQIRLNFEAAVVFTHSLLGLAGKGCQIINVSSTAALCPGPGMALYYASKAGMLSWSRALEFELAGNGVQVLSYCPGPLKTGFVEKAGVQQRDYLDSAPDAATAAGNLMNRVYKRNKCRGLYIYPFKYRLLAVLQHWIPQNIAVSAVMRELQRRKGAVQ